MKKDMPKEVIFYGDYDRNIKISELEKIGAGHDGIVYRYNDDYALKVLKYNTQERKDRNLMTFDKAIYLKENLKLRRITNPKDILLDTDGNYAAYMMDYKDDVIKADEYRNVGNFTCGDLLSSVFELQEYFAELTKKNVLAKDINRGSYIYTSDFLYLCDMDKYEINNRGCEDLNKRALNFVIAKLLYYEMLKNGSFDNLQMRQLANWVKKCANARNFIGELDREIVEIGDYKYPISEYTKQKVKKII